MKKTLGQVKIRLEFLFFERFWGDLFFPFLMKLLTPARNRVKPDAAKVNSVLVWNVDSPGDVLWITPSLSALRKLYPTAKISVTCTTLTKGLLENNPNVDELIPVKAEKFYLAKGFLLSAPEFENRSFEVMLILEMGSRPADRARLLARQMKVGYLVSSNLGHLKRLCDHVLPENGGAQKEYWPRYFLKAVEHLGAKPTLEPVQLEVYPDKNDSVVVDQCLKKWTDQFGEKQVVVLHPCVAPYAGLTKKWPQEHFVTLAEKILKRPIRLVISGAASDLDECMVLRNRIVEKTGEKDVHVIAGALSMRQSCDFFSKTNAVVTADTAALHFALTSSVKVIALFGATDPERIAPRKEGCIALAEKIECGPCHQPKDAAPYWPKCVYSQPECMRNLSPDRVALEVSKYL